ncbi:carotenoid 1,2-hydratase [Rhodococcus sp. SRB_17]|nr:carotenoid 1,2-hydratase [Rhodococcus sp. SRB_17]
MRFLPANAPPPDASRRQWLAWAAGTVLAGSALPAWALPPRQLQFPRDFGSHPDLRTEWWYITGQARAGGQRWGFQVTFFRSRVDAAQGMQSAFAARQLLFAHAALTDLQAGRLHHDQRIARAGFGVAQASEADTDIRLQDWSLRRTGQGPGSRYSARVTAGDFVLRLDFDTTQPVLLQGQQGLSRKGPGAAQASYYYSQPQLQVGGSVALAGRQMAVEPAAQPGDNRAWLDHEASEALMHPQAVGWDWIGMNLHDGSALTAFRLRRADGSALWAGGSWRAPGAAPRAFAATEVVFTPLRWWASPLGPARYPVQWRVDTPAGRFEVRALLDNQELDSRGSTGAIYWEGLCALHAATGEVVGGGYLEMTGYAQALRL